MYKVIDICKSYADLKVLDNISIDFPENKVTCILGPSGCGKSTLLNIIGGILDEDSGQVIGFKDASISFVFQEDRLIKWKSVKDNLRFVLKGKMDKMTIEETIDSYLKSVNLSEYKSYYPNSLSGGMKQRISILRAFIYPSQVLIMDEPFKSLDVNNKRIVIDFFKKLQSMEKRTCIIVTHDIGEAMELADRIVILSDKPSRVVEVMDNIHICSQDADYEVNMRNQIEEILMN
jgi:NitT/TauT family transport system ATP-binding protein